MHDATLDHVGRSIELLRDEITELERTAAERKCAVNHLCQALGRPVVYADEASAPPLRGDEFYGMPLAIAAMKALEWRRRSGQGPASVGELYDLLVRGGFQSRSSSPENARRNLHKVLREDTRFHRLPNQTYGLATWYPHASKQAGEGEGEDAAPEFEQPGAAQAA